MILRPGVFLQDRYEILEQIGSGGMSVVYKAKCHKLNRQVAIKVLKEEFCNDSNFVSKFKMEAQAAAGLAHPNIVNIYDVVDEGKLHYIVMELIEGITLKTYIARKGRLEVKESIGIAIQVAQGIAAAHEQHIIHRDIKPQNMLVSMDGKVKVADFGIARAVSAQTMTSSAMGSVHYISPEQARGSLSDERSDIYSLGVTMYEMVTGRVPFDGETTVAVALAHLEDAVVPANVYNPEVPAGLEGIILRCMEKKPERRYGSVNDVIADLRRLLVIPGEDYTRKPVQEYMVPDENKALADTDTRKISDHELDQIQRAAGKRNEKARKNYRRHERQKLREAEELEDDDGVNPYIERILAGAGIVAAVVVIAVLVVVFTKLGGVFRSGSGLFRPGIDSRVRQSAGTGSESTLGDTEVYMPDVFDLSEDLAEQKLKESYLNMKCTYEFSDDIQKGNVIRQDPAKGTVVSKWSNVNVVVSNGTDKIDVSQLGLETLDLEAARRVLVARRLAVVVEEVESESIDQGKVLRYEPSLVAEGGTVTLFVGSGPRVERVPVPNLVGMEESDAIAALAEAGLSPGTADVEESETVVKGYVIRQSGGDEDGMIDLGGEVDYVVSSGPPVVETTAETAQKQRYVASINDVYDLSNLIGPGAGTASVTVAVRLHQKTDGKDIYKELTPPETITGNILLPISYTAIESMNGTDQGEVEVVDVDSGYVLKSYKLTFFPMD